MTNDAIDRPPEKGLLQRRSVFLSASVPSPARAEKYSRVPDAQVEIEDAVVNLARAVFAEGGRLVFGGHPSISPLVAMVAAEYRAVPAWSAGDGLAPRVLIHQLDVFKQKGEIPDATTLMERLGQAKVQWHQTDPIEAAQKPRPGEPPYPASMERMRRGMIEDSTLAAMICIGGMEGVERESELFLDLQRGKPVHLMTRSGGATALLVERYRMRTNVRATDQEVLDAMRETVVPRYTPYAAIMQRIVRQLRG